MRRRKRSPAALEALDYKLTVQAFFDTLEVTAETAVVQSLALEEGFNFFYPSEERVRLSFDEVTTPEEVETIIGIFAAAKGRKPKSVKQPKKRFRRSAPPVGLPDRTGLQQLPVGKRLDALHQEVGAA